MSVDFRLFGLVIRVQLAMFLASEQQYGEVIYDSALVRVLQWSSRP